MAEPNIEESNLAHIGNDAVKAARKSKAAAALEAAWEGAGSAPGVRMWRVENGRGKSGKPDFGVSPWPVAGHGIFLRGDAYVILETTTEDEEEGGEGARSASKHDVYFWIGSASTQDKYAVAALKAKELGELLGEGYGAAAVRHHRELEGLESSGFLRCFQSGAISCVGGEGSPCGFRRLDKKCVSFASGPLQGAKPSWTESHSASSRELTDDEKSATSNGDGSRSPCSDSVDTAVAGRKSSTVSLPQSEEKTEGAKTEEQKEGKETRIKVGKFSYRGQAKEYAIVPPALIADDRALEELREFWKLDAPSTIIEVNASKKERVNIIEEEDTRYMLQKMFLPDEKRPMEETASERKETEKWVRKLQEGEALPCPNYGADEELGDGDGAGGDYLPMINMHVHRKSVLALKSVVSAAEMNNGWLLCHGKPTANEKMLESAIDRTESTKLTILVVDNMKRYCESEKGKEIWKKMWDNSKYMSEEIGKRSSIVSLPSEHLMPSNVQRITTVSWPPTCASDSSVWAIEDGDDWKEVKWEASWPWERGTHYIFCENYGSFEPQKLGQHGYVCLHGEGPEQDSDPKTTGFIIREAISTVRPCLLFNNTGGETMIYAQLINRIRWEDETKREGTKKPESLIQNQITSMGKCCPSLEFFSWCCGKKYQDRQVSPDREMQEEVNAAETRKKSKLRNQKKDPEKSYYDELKMDLRKKAWYLQKHAIKGCSKKGAEMLTIDRVLMVVDLYCSNPSLFSSVVVPVDPLNDDPDDIVKKLTMSFARSDLERKEVGAGDADKKAIERAWRLHHQLTRSEEKKWWMRNVLYFIYIIAGICTTAVAVIETIESLPTNWLRWLAFGLAATVSVCSGILNLNKFDTQLARIQTAKAKIICELFQFRMRVGKYSLNPRERGLEEETSQEKQEEARDETKSERESANKSAAMHQARARFSQALSSIFQELVSLDLYFDTLAQGELTKEERALLEDYVYWVLWLHKDPKVSDEMIVSEHMIPNDYYKVRVLPLVKYLEKQEDTVRTKTRGLQISSMLCSSAAMVLGAANVIAWIPIIVALSTGLFQVIKVMDYDRRLEIISSAAREIGALDAYWEALSPLDRCSRSTKVHLVRTCEQLALQFATSSVIQVDRAELGMDESNEGLFPTPSTATAGRNTIGNPAA